MTDVEPAEAEEVETEAATIEEEADLVREWAADWADKFDQSWTVEKLSELVGKRIKAEKEATDEDPPRGFVGVIVGYSVDTLVFRADDEGGDDEYVYRYSLITAEGAQCGLFSGMEVTEAPEE